MSHFSVLVVAENEKELEEKLLPYHEYECTGIEQYIEFVPTDLVEAAERLKENNEQYAESHPEWVYENLDTFIPAYYGDEKNKDGIWGRIMNKNKKWDWWVVGGRWKGWIINKNGFETNFCSIGEIDTEKMRLENNLRSVNTYRAWQNRPDKDDPGYSNYIFENHLLFVDQDEVHDLESMSEQEYASKYGFLTSLTYALVDKDGKWHARAEMGWFGVDYDQNADYDWQYWQYWQYLNSLEPATTVYVVDCHI